MTSNNWELIRRDIDSFDKNGNPCVLKGIKVYRHKTRKNKDGTPLEAISAIEVDLAFDELEKGNVETTATTH